MKANKALLLLAFVCLVVPFGTASGGSNLYSGNISEAEIQRKRGSYQARLGELEEFRQKQGKHYAEADETRKKILVREARTRLENALLQDVFPAWYGTDWAFSGTSVTPGEGKIACGYFVSTCLVQVGFKVNRVKLAQQPSQRIIESFMDKSDRKILADGKPMSVIREYLKSQGDGIYIVGLDRHVGFVSVWGDDMAFVHSAYYEPDSYVKSEKIETKNPLSDSGYRVFGKLFSDEMVVGWLSGRVYPVKEAD